MDNTPDPEPQDVQAHLIGGIPQSEVDALGPQLSRFGIAAASLFHPERSGYQTFVESIADKPTIKRALEADAALTRTLARHQGALADWWQQASDDFAELEHVREQAGNGGRKAPEIRRELIASLEEKIIPLGVLDEFKSAGVFVNWWQQIRYDIKTIIASGWHHSLIPDAYLVAAFFQKDADAIEALEAKIAEAQAELDEAVVTAVEVAGWELDADEKATSAVIKKALKALIDDLANATGASADRERDALKAQDAAIKAIEKHIKDAKAKHKTRQAELTEKLALKRSGGDAFKAEQRAQITQINQRMSKLDVDKLADLKQAAKLAGDKEALQARITRTDALLKAIGGQLTDEEARTLILKKIDGLARAELTRYLNAEKRAMISSVENLWDKYAVSSRELEAARGDTLKALDGMLAGLGYL